MITPVTGYQTAEFLVEVSEIQKHLYCILCLIRRERSGHFGRSWSRAKGIGQSAILGHAAMELAMDRFVKGHAAMDLAMDRFAKACVFLEKFTVRKDSGRLGLSNS